MPHDPVEQPLARNRDFKVLLTSQGVSALGDGVTFTALPLLDDAYDELVAEPQGRTTSS